jgi:GH25 family lysozyme M1 (1,4-beta-N-acetylmuramidase)
VLIKPRQALAASALALALAGGSIAVIRVVSPSGSVVPSSAMPSLAGPPATAAVPPGAGSAEDAESAAAAAEFGGQQIAGVVVAPLARSAGQGNPGPLPAGTLPADGAVPGASPSIQAQAAARAAVTALPHSPQLLAALAGSAGTGASPSPTGSSASGPSPTGPSPTGPTPTGPTPTDPSAQAALAVAASPLDTATPGTATPTAPGTGTPTSPGTATPTAPGTSPAAPGTPTMTSAPSSSPAATPTPAKPTPSAKPVPPKPPRRLPGLDVAAFQHPGGAGISWNSVVKAGYKFAEVKATEGDYYVNPYAAGDLKSAKAAGLDVAPYHFGIPNASGGAAQAQFAVEYSGYAPGPRMMPLTLDIEYDPYVSSDRTNVCYGLSASRMTAWLAAFVGEARALTGQYPVIYTTADWWDTCTGRSAAFGADPMWIAAYGFTSPPMPPGWKTWTFWQYTSSGSVPGVATAGGTDLDAFSPTMVGLIYPGTQSGRCGSRVSLAVTSLGAMAGEALTYSAVGLPPGLAVASGGTITGTIPAAAAPKTTTTYKVTVTVKNAAGTTATAFFNWKVSPA